MNEKIKKAIKVLVESVEKKMDASDALKITQAALNLAHTLQVLETVK